MDKFIIDIEVEYENFKTSKRTIDLSSKLAERNINPNDFIIPYLAAHPSTSISSTIPVSGGFITPIAENINLIDGTKINIPVSFNIRARFDARENLWNIDVYVDRHDYDLSEKERKLICKHEESIHKVRINNYGNSKTIKIHWWLNGEPQPLIEGFK